MLTPHRGKGSGRDYLQGAREIWKTGLGEGGQGLVQENMMFKMRPSMVEPKGKSILGSWNCIYEGLGRKPERSIWETTVSKRMRPGVGGSRQGLPSCPEERGLHPGSTAEPLKHFNQGRTLLHLRFITDIFKIFFLITEVMHVDCKKYKSAHPLKGKTKAVGSRYEMTHGPGEPWLLPLGCGH